MLTNGIEVDGRKYFYAGQSNSQLKARSCMLIHSNSLQEVSDERAWHCVLILASMRCPSTKGAFPCMQSLKICIDVVVLLQKSHADNLWAIATYLCSRLKKGQRSWATFRQSSRPLSDRSASASYSRPALQSQQLVNHTRAAIMTAYDTACTTWRQIKFFCLYRRWTESENEAV